MTVQQISSEEYSRRLQKIEQIGHQPRTAAKIFQLDEALANWPGEWGNNLLIWLYGGIIIDEDIDIPELGIQISATKHVGKFIFHAPFAYQCFVHVKSRDNSGIMDALSRLEKFLNSWHVISQQAIQYYCHLFLDAGDSMASLTHDLSEIQMFIKSLTAYTPHQQEIILRAAWWLRWSRQSNITGHFSPSLFASYSCVWNALECLVEVICQIAPPSSSPKIKKAKHLSKRAKHAFKVVFGTVWEEFGQPYFQDCFTREPKELRLYQIRNDINHGNIVEYELEHRFRVMNGLDRLQIIVYSIFDILTWRKFVRLSELHSHE